jgi:hypothetical protein
MAAIAPDSAKKALKGNWPLQLVSDIARAAVLFAIRNALSGATQLAMGVLLAPLAVHHMCIS